MPTPSRCQPSARGGPFTQASGLGRSGTGIRPRTKTCGATGGSRFPRSRPRSQRSSSGTGTRPCSSPTPCTSSSLPTTSTAASKSSSSSGDRRGTASKAQPFCLWGECYDPHEPWDPPQWYVDLYDSAYEGGEPYTPREGSSDYLTPRQLKRMRALYSAEVTMVDRWLGRFLRKMEELELFENTVLVLLSDHGHALGEHGLVGKPVQALWPELTDIVFLLRQPAGKGAGKTSDYYASTHDVAPTILGILGIDPPEPMGGQNLSIIPAGGKPEARDHFSLGYHNFVWARDEAHVYFSRNDGAKAKLYDVRTDPKMRNNLAQDHPAKAKRMFEDYVLKDAGGPLPRY